MKMRLFVLLAGIACAACPGADGSFEVHRDIAYGTESSLLSLDVYSPTPAPGAPAPVVIWVHGGGWSIGDKAYQMRYKPELFTGAGYCLVSINYRLSPRPVSDDPNRIKYPVHEQDVASAVAWVHEHIAEYGGDPSRIALMGHSAGAHLVSIVSTDESFLGAKGLTLGAIKGTISLDTEGYDIPTHMQTDNTGIYVNAFGNDPAVWHEASPIFHVASGKGIPPFLLVTRGLAPRRLQCTKFAEALRGVGVTATVVDATGYSHGDVNTRIGAPGETVVTPPVMQFLAGCFATTEKAR
jgi:acetyl esterase/lipase